jgi:hypothetical protein
MRTEAVKLQIRGAFPEYKFVMELHGTATSIAHIRELLRLLGAEPHLPTSVVQTELSHGGAFEVDLSRASGAGGGGD